MKLIAVILLFSCFSVPAFADSIDYASAGSVSQKTATVTGQIAPGKVWSVTDVLNEVDDTTTNQIMQGNLGTVDITTGTLQSTGAGNFSFVGGSVLVKNTSGGVIFTSTFNTGTITNSNGISFLSATFGSGGTVEIASRGGTFSSNTITTTVGTVTPEPTTLLMLGTGLIGLFTLRRKFHGGS